MLNISIQGESLRFIILILIAFNFFVSPAIGSEATDFDSFMKSREVVATLYFQASAEELSKAETEKLSGVIKQLRKTQENGRMIRVEGFSSPEGDQEKNFILSFFRARIVADFIEAKGLPSEVTLTGYGDLKASSNDPSRERRVEIASYAKPVGAKRIRIVKTKEILAPELEQSTLVVPEDKDIDSYRLDQAIRRKINDKNGDIADRLDELDNDLRQGLKQTKLDIQKELLDRGYTQWRKSVDPELAQKLTQAKKALDEELSRGYSQWSQEAAKEASPGVTQLDTTFMPVIDVLTIEQAIMEKIGTEPQKPSGEVTQVDTSY